MKATVVLEHLSVWFGDRQILREVDISFASGGITVLVGRSGSGKTTLLRCINRLNEEFPGCRTLGQVYLDLGQGLQAVYPAPAGSEPGKRRTQQGVFDLPELRRKVGMLFQTPNLFPVSIRKNIALPLRLVGGAARAEIEGRIENALRAAGLWPEVRDRLNAPASQLSGGQQQRLCLARLLALEPSILLLDEPTASLDLHAARQIESLLLDLSARYPIIMVSHSLRQAARLARAVVVCEAGRLEQPIAPDEALFRRIEEDGF